MSTIHFAQIHPKAFAHPEDLKATTSLEGLPILPALLKQISKLNFEQRFRAEQMHHSIQLGPRQFPSLWRMVADVAERFGMPEPLAYVSRRGGINAFAFGMQQHTIILTSDLVDLMTDRELEAIIAHELGHILCQHMLYKGVGLALANGAVLPSLSKLAPAALIKDSTQTLLMRWNRAAEYSADRAALLVLQDPEALALCMGRLAGIPSRFLSEFDPRRFAEQVQEFEVESTFWSRLVTFGMDVFLTHPEPAKRAAAALEWSKSEDYKNILAGRYLTWTEFDRDKQIKIEGVKSCLFCGKPVGEKIVCDHCGFSQDPAAHIYCKNDHVNMTTWKFCKSCGAKLSLRIPPEALSE